MAFQSYLGHWLYTVLDMVLVRVALTWAGSLTIDRAEIRAKSIEVQSIFGVKPDLSYLGVWEWAVKMAGVTIRAI